MPKWLKENRPAVIAVIIVAATTGFYYFINLPPTTKPAPKHYTPAEMAQQECATTATYAKLQGDLALSKTEQALLMKIAADH